MIDLPQYRRSWYLVTKYEIPYPILCIPSIIHEQHIIIEREICQRLEFISLINIIDMN